MTVGEVLKAIDEIKPNLFQDGTKTRWISECEAGIVLHVSGQKTKPLKFPDDIGRELSVPHPYDKIYLEYLEAAIDYRNQDYAKYENSRAIYNATFDEYARWWERNKYDL